MYSKELKTNAFERFLRGDTLEKISSALEIKFPAISKWCWKENWIDKRIAFQDELAQTLYKRMIDKIETSCQLFLDCSKLIAEIGIREIRKIDEQSKKTGEFDFDKFARLVNAMARASVIHKNVVPNADEEISEKILNELQTLTESRRAKVSANEHNGSLAHKTLSAYQEIPSQKQ